MLATKEEAVWFISTPILAQKMVKNCKRKEYQLYKAKRSISQNEDTRLSTEGGDAPMEVQEHKPHKEVPKKTSSSKIAVSKLELPPEVVDELIVMGGLDKMRVLERPRTTMQLPWKLRPMEISEDPPPHTAAARWVKSEIGKRSQSVIHFVESSKTENPEFEVSQSTVVELENILRQPAHTFETKYRVLDTRDKLMQIKNAQRNLSNRKQNHGTCPDMCPEKERYLRKIRHQVDYFETRLDDSTDGYHQYAVKQYARSSADQQMPLAHDLRPVSVLRITMNHLIREFTDLADDLKENLGDWYHFLWDRTRSIRKDITQQEICDLDAVAIVEQCVRFHIFCCERMREEDLAVYDEKINTDNMTKCLQTLKYMYSDLSVKGIICANEAEFQAYKVLLNLNSGSVMLEIQTLEPNVQHSKEIKFATKVYLALSDNNYVKFFKLMNSTTYLNACILHRYFLQVRERAMHTMIAAYSFRKREITYPLADIQNLLLFDSAAETAEFCNYLHLRVIGDDVILQHIRRTYVPSSSLPKKRSSVAIESKRSCSIKEIITGNSLSDDAFPLYPPHNSFDSNGILKVEAWNAEDQSPHQFVAETSQPQKKTEETPMEVSQSIPSPLPQFKFTVPDVVPAMPCPKVEAPKLPEPVSQQEHIPISQEETKFISPVPSFFGGVRREPIRPAFQFIVPTFPEEEPVAVAVPKIVTQPGHSMMMNEERKVEEVELKEPEVIQKEEVQQSEQRNSHSLFHHSIEEDHSNATVVSPKPSETPKEFVPVPKPVIVTSGYGDGDNNVVKPANVQPDELEEEVQEEEGEEEDEDQGEEEGVEEEEVEEEEKDEEIEIIEEKRVREEEEEEIEETLEKEQQEEEEELDEVQERLSTEEPFTPERPTIIRYANPDFPAWFSPLSLAEQAEQLKIPGLASAYKFKDRRFPKPLSYFMQKRSWPDIGSVYMENVISEELFRTLQDSFMLEHEMLWKVLLSVPDPDESPRYCDALLRWIDETFSQYKTKLKDVPQQLEILRLAREKTKYGILNSSVERVVGYLEKPEPLIGINGILFFEASDSEREIHRYQRLLRILELRQPFPLLPVAVITDSQRLLNEDQQWLQVFVDNGSISQFKLFRRTDVTVEKTAVVVIAALKWLALNTPKSPNFEVVSLKDLWNRLLIDEIWSRISFLATNRVKWVNQKPNELIELHNNALQHICQSCLNSELFDYSTGAPEFSSLLEKSFYPPKIFTNRIMPEYWGTEDYKRKIKMACNSAKIPCKLKLLDGSSIPFSDFVEICLETYPELTKELNHIIWILCQNAEFAEDLKQAHIIQALAEMLVARGTKVLGDEDLIIAIRKQDLAVFRKLYSSKLFLSSTDVLEETVEENGYSPDGCTASKKTKLESPNDKILPDSKPEPSEKLKKLEEEAKTMKVYFKKSKEWLLKMETKVKENELALKRDLAAFDMLPGRRKKPIPKKGKTT